MQIRAARLVAHGEPLEVAEIELQEPDVSKEQVLVEMAFAGVNPVDRYQAIGRVAPDAPLPRTLGSEGAGRVDGKEVFVSRDALVNPGDGIWASHVVARRDALVEVPPNLGLEVAASVGVVGVTAWRCVVDVGQVTADDRVLVFGASGGVGSAIVSLARSIGAEVVAQTGSESKRQWLAGRDPSRIVVGDAAQLAGLLAGWHPTVVIDPLGGEFTGAGIDALAERGRLVIFGTSAGVTGELPLQQLYRKMLTVHGYGGLIEPADRLADGARKALAALADGRMEIVIDEVLPLAAVNEAFAAIVERRVRGKLVLDLRG
jgi:NADPH2:quinone reductase